MFCVKKLFIKFLLLWFDSWKCTYIISNSSMKYIISCVYFISEVFYAKFYTPKWRKIKKVCVQFVKLYTGLIFYRDIVCDKSQTLGMFVLNDFQNNVIWYCNSSTCENLVLWSTDWIWNGQNCPMSKLTDFNFFNYFNFFNFFNFFNYFNFFNFLNFFNVFNVGNKSNVHVHVTRR